MNDPAGSDRVQQEIPTTSGTGNSPTGDSFADGDVARAERADPSGRA